MPSDELLKAVEQTAVAIGRYDAELRGHPLAKAHLMRARVEAAVSAVALNGLRVDRGRLFSRVGGVPVEPVRDYGAEQQALSMVVFIGHLCGVNDVAVSGEKVIFSGDKRGLEDAENEEAWEELENLADEDDGGWSDLRLVGLVGGSSQVSREEMVRSAEAAEVAEMFGLPGLLESAEIMLEHLRGSDQATALLAAADLGWVLRRERDGKPGVIHYALPAWLHERGLTSQPIPGLCDFPARIHEEDWRVAFVRRVGKAADDGRAKLQALTVQWQDWQRRIGPRRSDSRVHETALMALACPALSPGSVARNLSPKRSRRVAARVEYEELLAIRSERPLRDGEAARMVELAKRFRAPFATAGAILAELLKLGIVEESSGKTTHKLYTAIDLQAVSDAVRAKKEAQARAARRKAELDGLAVPVAAFEREREVYKGEVSGTTGAGDNLDALLDGLAAKTARTAALLAKMGFGLGDIKKDLDAEDEENYRF